MEEKEFYVWWDVEWESGECGFGAVLDILFCLFGQWGVVFGDVGVYFDTYIASCWCESFVDVFSVSAKFVYYMVVGVVNSADYICDGLSHGWYGFVLRAWLRYVSCVVVYHHYALCVAADCWVG